MSPDKAGAADVSFVAGEVPMIIDAIGLKGHDDHTPGETADLTTLPMQTKRAAVTLVRLGGAAGEYSTHAACSGRVIRHTSAIATTSSATASRNGAPGRCQSRCDPMNVANVSENSAGPTMPGDRDDAR